MANNVPVITIVQETDDDGDDDMISLVEALTDIEDFDEQQPKRQKSKLLIKISDNYGSNTDVEDIEGSDDETVPIIGNHTKPIFIDDISLDVGTVEETYNINTSNTKALLHSQRSLSIRNKSKLTKIEGNLTDVEYYSDDENMLRSNTPNPQLNLKYFEINDSIISKDSEKYDIIPTPSPYTSPNLSEDESIKKIKSNNKKLVPQLYNLTDIELVESEYEFDNSLIRKSKKNRKRRTKPQNSSYDYNTDLEEISTVSDTDQTTKTVGEFLDPKKGTSKKIPKKSPVEAEGTSDIEEFESNPKHVKKYTYDTTAINRQLRKIECLYGSPQEKCQFKKRKYQRQRQSNATDSDSDINRGKCKTKCDNSSHKINQNLKIFKNVPQCLTDVENFESSDVDIITNNTCIGEKVLDPTLTDEEILLDSINYVDSLPELKLPPPRREIVFVKENNSTPTVAIAPLPDDAPFGLGTSFFPELTDVESISGDENLLHENLLSISASYMELEGGFIQEFQSVYSPSPQNSLRTLSPQVEDALTDTEDIIVGDRMRINLLNTQSRNHSALTDTEDIFLSDNDQRYTGMKVRSKEEYLTDVEHIEESDDEICLLKRAGSTTSQHLREVSGDMIVVKEYRDSFGKVDQKLISKSVKKINVYLNSPLMTDNEDLETSHDEESCTEPPPPVRLHRRIEAVPNRTSTSSIHSNQRKKINVHLPTEVMYLKGGDYFEDPLNNKEDGNYIIAKKDTGKVEEPEHNVSSPNSRSVQNKRLRASVTKLVTKFDLLSKQKENDIQNTMVRILRVKPNLDISCCLSIKKRYNLLISPLNKGWSATHGESKDKPITTLTEKDALQGILPTPTAKYLASSKELSLDSPKLEKQLSNQAELLRQANAFIDAESKIEPFEKNAPHSLQKDRESRQGKPDQTTESLSRDSSREDTSRGDDRKPKKGFFGTLRSMVSKSQDRSDSETEKTHKKDVKKKKEKKKKSKPPIESLERPPRKPKLPTPPTEDRPELRDIPFVEYSPQEQINLDAAVCQKSATDLNVPEDIKAVANDIVSEVISTGETTVVDIVQNGGTTRGKQVVIREEITKAIEPKIYESGEFRIVVSPIIPPKTRDFFKSDVQDIAFGTSEPPIRPLRRKEHIYEDIREMPATLTQDNKLKTNDFILHEINFSGWADDKYNLHKPQEIKNVENQSQKATKKQGKLFGFLTKKSSKDVEESDNEKDVIEKQDRELSKERSIKFDSDDEVEEQKKSSFFGIFGKKTKKEDPTEEREGTEGKEESTTVVTVTQEELPEVVPVLVEQLSTKAIEVEAEAVEQQEQVCTKTKEVKKSRKEKVLDESDDESEHKKSGFFGFFGKKGKRENKEEVPKPVFTELSKAVRKDMQDTTAFLEDEVKHFDDVKVFASSVGIPMQAREELKKITEPSEIFRAKPPREIKADSTSTKKSKSKDICEKRESSVSEDEAESTRKSGIFNIFGRKHKRSKSREKSPKPVSDIKLQKDVTQISHANSFLQKEVEAFDDVKPVNGFSKHLTESTQKKLSPLQEPTSMDEIKNDPISETTITRTVEKVVDEHVHSDQKKSPTKEIKEIQFKEQIRAIERTVVYEPIIRKEVVMLDDIQKEVLTLKKKAPAPDLIQTTDIRVVPFKTNNLSRASEQEDILDKQSKQPLHINEEVLMNMISTSNFLRDEIDHFDDVRCGAREPLITKEQIEDKKISRIKSATEEPESPKKGGFLGMFTRKQKPEENLKDKKKKQQMVDLCAETAQNIDECNKFLADEVTHFNDVRLVTIPKEECTSKQTEDTAALRTAKVYSDAHNQTSPSAEEFVGLISSVNNFLLGEQNNFDDVRPIIQTQSSAEKEEVLKKDVKKYTKGKKIEVVNEKDNEKSTGLFKLFGKKDKKSKEKKPTAEKGEKLPNPEINIEDSSLRKSDQVNDTIILSKDDHSQHKQPPYSEELIRTITDTQNFLTDEVTHFDDVRCIVKEQIIISNPYVKVSTKKKEEKKKKMKGDKSESGDESESSKPAYFSFAFVKKHKQDPDKEKDENVQEKKLIVKDPQIDYLKEFKILLANTGDFLDNEVARYHDVRLMTHTLQEIECKPQELQKKAVKISKKNKTDHVESEEDNDIGKAGGLFKFFGRREKKEKCEKTEMLDDQKVAAEDKITKTLTEIELQKDFVNVLVATDTFLADEIVHFEDVKPMVQRESSYEEEKTPRKENEKKKRRSYRESSESGDESDSGKSSGFFKFFSKKDKKEIEAILPEDVKGEEVEKVTTDTTKGKATAEEKPKPEKKPSKKKVKKEKIEEESHKSLFGIFGKKEKPVKATTDSAPRAISDETAQNMENSEDFLKQEINNFEDVKTLQTVKSDINLDGKMTIAEITKTAEPKVYETDDFKIVISPTQDTKIKAFSININETIEQIEKEMLSCKESGIPVSDEAPVLSIERSKKEYDDVIISQPPGKFELVTDELEVKAQMVKFASPQPPVSQETLKKMIDTSNFLNQEISRFEDVKPVTKYEHTPLSKEEEDKLSKNKPKHKQKSIDDDSKKSGFFGFFGRKEKKPDTMEAQIERIKIEEPTKEYKVATSKKILEVGEEELEESEKIVLSDELQLNIQQRPFEFQEIIHFTNNFLNNEIKNYNDVKIQGPKLEQAAVLSAEHELEQKEEKNKGKSLFGIFTRKSEERSIPDSTKEVIMKEKRERRKSGSPFKMFSKKSKDVSESEVTSSAQVQHDIYETKNFLSTEVEHYQDVKETTEKPSVTKKSVAFLEDAVFDQLEDSRAEMQQTEKVIVVIKDDVTDALTLQKNVIEAPISEELNIKYQPVLDADIDKEKSTSKEFKKSAGFLTKLGDKISGKTKDVKAVAIDNSSIDLDRVCEETKKQTEDTKTKSDALQKESLQTEAKKKSSFFTKITGKSKNIQEQIDTPIKQTSNKVETLKEDAQEVIQIPTNQTSHRIEVVQMADDKINEYTKENTDALKNLKLKFIELQESISDCSQQFLEKEIEVTSPTVTDVKDNLLEKVIKQNEYLEAPANEIEVDKKGGQSITNLPAITEAQSKDIKKPTEKTGSFFGRLGERLTGKARYDKEYVEETSQDVLDQINESVRETKEEVDKPKLEIEHEKQENDKAMEEINDDQNETVRGSLIQTKDITVRKIHDVQKGVESKTDQIKDNLPTAVEDNIRQATQKFENTKYTMDNTLVKIDKIISETGTSVTPDIEQSGLDRKTTATEVEAYGKENAEIKGSQTTLKGLDILKEQVQNFTLLEENVSYVQQQLQNEANDIENVKPKMADVLEQASSEFVDNIQSATFKDSMYKTFDDTETQPRSQHDIERSGGAKDDMSDHETPPLTVDLDQLDKTKPKDRKRRKEKRKSGGFFSKLGEKLSGKSKEVNDAVTETGDKLRETVADTPEIMEDLLSDTTEEIVAEVKKVEEFKVDIQETKDSTEVNIEHEQSIGKKEHMREDMKQSKDKTVMNYSDLEDNVTDEILNVSKFSGVKTLDIQEDIKKSNEKLQEIISGVEDKMLHTMMENVSELQTDFNRVIKQSGTPLVETSLDAKSSAQQSVELVTSEVDTAESYEDTKGASAYKIVDFLDHEKQQALETSEATTTVRIMEESIKTATKSKKHKDKKQKERKKSGGFLTGLGNKIFGGSKEKPKEASHGTAESIKPKKNDLQKAADINEKHVETLDTLQDREERVSDEVHSLKELKDESREKICTVGVAIEKQATSGTESYAKEDVAKSLAGDTKRTEKEVVEFTSDLENKEYETDDRTLHKVESSQDQETTTADVLESAKEVTVSKLKDQSETVDEILHEIRADGNEFVQDVEEHTDETAGNKKLRAEETVKHRIEEISQAGAVLDHTTAAAANYSQSAGEIVESHASKLLGATKDTLKDVNKSTKGFTDDSRESAKELAYYTQIFFSNQDDKIFGMGTPLEKTTTGTVGNMKSTGEATETKVKGLCDAAKDTVEDITGCTKYVDDGKHQTTKVVDDDTQLSMSDLEGKIYKEQVKVKYDSTEKVPKVERPLDQPFLTVIENVKSATKMVDAKVIHVVGATKKTLEEIKDSVTSSAERSKEHDRKSAQHSRSTQAESSLSGSSEKMIGTGQNVKDDGEEDLKIEVILEPEATPRTSSTKSDDIARKENVNTTTNEKLPKIRENVIDIANESKSKSEIDPEGIHAFDSGLENKLKIVEKIIKDTDKASVVGTALNQAATTTTGLTKYVEDTVKTTAKDLEQAAKDVKDSTLNFSDDNNSKIDKVAHKIQSTISGLPENVLETVKDECTLTGSELGIALEQAVTSIIQSTKPAAEIVENNLKDVNQATSNNIEELRSNFKNFVDDSENQVKKVVDTSQSFFSSLADISSTADEKVVDIEAEKVSKSRTALTQAAPNTTEFEKSTVDIQIKDVPQETRDALSDSNDSANETVNANEQQTNSAVGETCMNFSGIENKISETRKELGDHTAGEFSMIGRMLEQSAITTTGSANSILGTNEKSLEEVSKDKLGDPEYIPEDITDKSEKQAQEETNKIQFLIFEQGDKICETKEQMETEATITLSESVAALSSATIVQTEPVKKVVDTKIKNLNQAIKDKLTDAADHDNNVNDTSKERVKKKADKTQNVLCDLGSKTVKTEEKPKSESEEKVDPGADNQQGPVKDVKVLVGNVEKDINDFKGDPKRSCQLFIEVEQYVESTDPYKIKTTKDSCKEFEHQGKYMELSGVTKGDKTISEKGTSVFKEEGAKFCSKSKDFQGKRSKKSKKLDDTIADEKSSPLVTSPTLPRRAESQRMSRDDVHYCIDVTKVLRDESSGDELYIVTEPIDQTSARISDESIRLKRKPLFHLESEDSFDLSSSQRDTIRSNVLESLSEQHFETLVTDLDDYEETVPTDTQFTANMLYDEAKSWQPPTDTDLIEQKLSDIEKALGSLEQTESLAKEGGSEGKLKRVERKFERMASEVMEIEKIDVKDSKLTTPEVEERRESDFRQVLSQLSTEEVSDFQKEYAALWDEQTFSRSDEWDTSKSPDSQADVQELPQGETSESQSKIEQQTSQQPMVVTRVETDETTNQAATHDSEHERPAQDQHMLSEEMKRLLKELEEESKK